MSPNTQAPMPFVYPAMGMFISYIGHDALQEKMFHFEGFEFGWFMTWFEVTFMLLSSLIVDANNTAEHAEDDKPLPSRSTLTACSLIGICIALSHGCGNTALNFTTYPMKVAFKSCKLVPTMWLGWWLTSRKYTWKEYTAACIMCTGLAFLTLAEDEEVQSSRPAQHSKNWIGPSLLFASTCLDAIVPNLQERLFVRSNISTSELMLYSNGSMCILTLSYCTLLSSEWWQAYLWFKEAEDMVPLSVLLGQALCANTGLVCYLHMIRRYGGIAAVLVANSRKICTICLSFMLFHKPCRRNHITGLIFILIGVAVGAKRKQVKKLLAKSNSKNLQEHHDHAV